jgi:hypothetical protein
MGLRAKNHRTVVFFDVRGGVDSEGQERMQRFAQSVGGDGQNQSSIKVDFNTVTETGIVPGFPTFIDPVVEDDDLDLEEVGQNAGYKQVIVISA